MKLSSYYKKLGDYVEWYSPDEEMYDIVYMSKVFSDQYSPDIETPKNAKSVVRGGTGYAIKLVDGKKMIRLCQTILSTHIQITLYTRNIQVMVKS